MLEDKRALLLRLIVGELIARPGEGLLARRFVVSRPVRPPRTGDEEAPRTTPDEEPPR